MALEPGPVHAFAERAKLPVRTPLALKGADEQAEFAALDLDAAIVVPMGCCCPKPFWMRRDWAVSICTDRCCRAGAAPPRSSAR
jgi:methionyl-tRNA formyltransferase